jgi:hypothetical protein
MAGRPEGVGSTGRGFLATIGACTSRETTPSVAFGDISPSRGEISSSPLQAEHQLAEMQAAGGHVGIGFSRFAR